MAVTNINISLDSDIKSEAQELLDSLGLDLATAIKIFLLQTIKRRGIPFAIVDAPLRKTPKPGCMKGKIWLAEDFDEPLDDFQEYME